MRNVRLLPVVVLAVAALLVLKTLGLATSGGYMLLGVTPVRAAGGGGGGETPAEGDASVGFPESPTLEDTSPTLSDGSPTLGGPPAAGGHGAPAATDHGAPAEADHGEEAPAAPAAAIAQTAPVPANATSSTVYCVEPNASITSDGEVVMNEAADSAGGHGEAAAEPVEQEVPEGSFAATVIDCLPSGDAVPMEIGDDGNAVPVGTTAESTGTEAQLLERLASRRAELEQFEQELTLRASLVDAAEQRIAERTATLEALEQQIATLVEQRQQMEAGQFAGIVAMYETMKPKDAANIFNSLDMTVLLQVAKTMSPRKMSPIMAEMDPARAQELTVKLANISGQPADQMTPDDLAALPQIVGQ